MKLNKSPSIILGIDPGYERLGLAVIENKDKPILLFSDCIRTSAKKDFSQRLFEAISSFEQILLEWKPDLISIENLFVVKNQKTGMAVSEIRGAIKYLAQKNNVSVVEMTPPEIKLAITGYGQADKNAIFRMISKIFILPKKKMLDDEIDAIAIALAGTFRKI